MNKQGTKVIVTGVTGMVGEGVLHECLHHPTVSEALALTRRPTGMSHPRMKELVHQNFFDLSSIESSLTGYDACFFCLGVSSIGMKEADYHRVTHTLTLYMGETLSRLNPGMVFIYVSGEGTDSSEKGRSMWARVKGETENDLATLPFRKFYAFRPGFIRPTKGLKRTLSLYKYVTWMYPVASRLFPSGFCTLKNLGLAMIYLVSNDYEKGVIRCRDITELAGRCGKQLAVDS